MKENCENLKIRINKLKGQLVGIEKMIDDGRDVMDILQQVYAIRAAISQLGIELVKDESQKCFSIEEKEETQEKFYELVTSFFKLT